MVPFCLGSCDPYSLTNHSAWDRALAGGGGAAQGAVPLRGRGHGQDLPDGPLLRGGSVSRWLAVRGRRCRDVRGDKRHACSLTSPITPDSPPPLPVASAGEAEAARALQPVHARGPRAVRLLCPRCCPCPHRPSVVLTAPPLPFNTLKRLHRIRQGGHRVQDPLALVIDDLHAQAWLLCFDEFQVGRSPLPFEIDR